MKIKKLLCGITAVVVSASALSTFVSANDDVGDASTTASASEPKSAQNIEISGEFVSGDFKYEVIGEDKDAVRITGYIGKGGDVVIPNEIDGKPVTVLSTLSEGVWNNNKLEYTGENITSITIPENIAEIVVYDYVSSNFEKLPNLKSIKVDKNNKNYSSDEQGVLYNKDKTHLICCPLALTNLTIPESVIEIGTVNEEVSPGSWGYECYNPDLLNLRELQSIKVDEKNKNFSTDEQGILYNKDKTQLIVCTNTPETVTIPASVTSMYFINEYISFEKDSELVSINVDPQNKKYFSVDGVLYGKATEDSEYHKNGDVYLAMYPPEKKDAVYKIPETVNDCSNYINNSYITSIEIHADCRYSGKSISGLNCPNLASFSVTEGNPYVYAEDGVLFQKNYDQFLHSALDREEDFKDKPVLIGFPPKKTGEYTVPEGVILLGGIPAGAGGIDTTFPIGFLFGHSYSGSITSLTLPKDLTVDGGYHIISHSLKLKSVTIPKGIEKLRREQFLECTALSDINYGGTMAEWKEFTSTDEEHNVVWDGTVRYGNYPDYKYFSPTIHCTDGDIPANGDVPAPDYTPTAPSEGTKTYKPSISADGADEDTKNVLGGITATDYDGDAFDEDVFMSATAGRKTDYSLSFDITFTKDGEKVQPKTNTGVTVKVPVPEFLKNCTNIWVYHVNDKGEKENVSARVEDGYVIFYASRFSEYILSSKSLDEPANDPASSTPSADDTTSDAPSNSTPSKTDPGATDTDSSPETNDTNTSVEVPNKGNPNTGVAMAIAPIGLAAAFAVVAFKKKR